MFTQTGTRSTNIAQFNINGSFVKGYAFFTDGWKSGETFFFDALGFRDVALERAGTGNITNINEICNIWVSGASSYTDARIFNFISTIVVPDNISQKSYGLNCYSVK